MSIAMLQDPFKTHDILDDMESTFWSLLMGAIRYFAGKIEFSIEDFFYQKYKPIDGKRYVVGGDLKRVLLESSSLTNMPFHCAPLRNLITRLSNIWRKYYSLRSDAKPTFDDLEAQEAFKQLREQLSEPAYWIAILDEALKREDWLEADTIEDRYPSMPSKQADIQTRDQLFASVVDVETFLNRQKDNNPSRQAFGGSSPLTELSDSDASRASSPLADAPDSPDAMFPAIPPGPPQTVSNRSGSEGSTSSFQLNTNGKRTLSAREDSDDSESEQSDEGSSSTFPLAKRFRKFLTRARKAAERSWAVSQGRGGRHSRGSSRA